jgi:hypothetical protein
MESLFEHGSATPRTLAADRKVPGMHDLEKALLPARRGPNPTRYLQVWGYGPPMSSGWHVTESTILSEHL